MLQGEIDVVGIDLKNKKIYFCEVATHLTTGLQYVKNKRPNWQKIYDKFKRNQQYAKELFEDYAHEFMLWSPIVKSGKNESTSQMVNLEQVQKRLKEDGIDLKLMINQDFLAKINELSEYSASKTEELKSPVLRLLQIIQYTEKHVAKLISKNKY